MSFADKHPTSAFSTETERKVEIYKITCLSTNKSYVGQAVTHILNHTKYRRYGMQKRWNCHVSEAFSEKKNQCHYLNSAIRKYGPEMFNIKLLDVCHVNESDVRETWWIENEETMFPKGYNLKLGTKTTWLSLEGRKRVSLGVLKYYSAQKFERFKDVNIDLSKLDSYIRPLKRHGKQYGYYVYIDGKKADFGGVHIDISTSYENARNFIMQLYNLNSKTP